MKAVVHLDNYQALEVLDKVKLYIHLFPKHEFPERCRVEFMIDYQGNVPIPNFSRKIHESQIVDFVKRGLFTSESVAIDFTRTDEKKYFVHLAPVASVLSLQKPKTPVMDFEMAKTKRLEPYVSKYPHSKEATEWLKVQRKDKTNMGEVAFMAILLAEMMIEFVPFVCDISFRNDETHYTLKRNWKKEFEDAVITYAIADNKRLLTEGWDVVNLTSKQYYKVKDTITEHKIKFDIDNFALPRFCLAMYDSDKTTTYYHYEQKGRTVRCSITNPSTFMQNWFTVTIHSIDDNGDIHAIMHTEDDDVELHKFLNDPVPAKERPSNVRIWEWIMYGFFIINAFMLHFGDVTTEVETKQAKAPSEEGRKQKKHDRNSVRLFKSYKLVKNWKSQARKKAEITCPCWGVRGHFRHYKNGKVVFVEAYVKGKEKDNYKGKEYNLMPYKEA